METEIKKAEQILKKYNQENTIELFKNLDTEKQAVLAKSILNTDFDYVMDVFNTANQKKEVSSEGISPMQAAKKEDMTDIEREKYFELGKKVIQNNEYAVVTVAGGQGTRLGHSGPKGTFKVQTVNGEKYIFEILCEIMKEANAKYAVEIPWYIMTSEENNSDTENFFKDHNYFGYNPNKIKFFKQSKMPLMTTDGKILIDKDFKIKEASDGHGGIFNSMRKTGVINELENNNVKWIFTCGVDNILVNMVDPYLVGLAIEKICKIATRSLVKNSPGEKIGVLCKQGKKVKVIEYTELSEEMANMTDDKGDLLYGESHVMFNLFSLDAIKQISTAKLPYHIAFKKNDYLDKDGKLVKAEAPNSYKFESFIFDSFELFDDIAILRGKREDEFAPIKNATGNDSPETATNLYNNFWKGKTFTFRNY